MRRGVAVVVALAAAAWPATAAATTGAAARLRHELLSAPRPGFALVHDAAVDPATYGPFVSSSPAAEARFAALARRPGFAAWTRTWRDGSGLDRIVDLVVVSPNAAGARSVLGDLRAALSAARGGTFTVAGLPGARGYAVAVRPPGGTAVTDELAVVTALVGRSALLVETDSATSPAHAGTLGAADAVALAGRQAARLAPPPRPSGPSPALWAVPVGVVAAGGLVVAARAERRAGRGRHRRGGRHHRGRPAPDPASTAATAGHGGVGVRRPG